jgi:hypothetical protein
MRTRPNLFCVYQQVEALRNTQVGRLEIRKKYFPYNFFYQNCLRLNVTTSVRGRFVNSEKPQVGISPILIWVAETEGALSAY